MNDPRRPSKEATDLATTYLVVTAKGSFLDYVDHIFPIIDRTDIGERIFLMLYGNEKLHTADIFSTTYLPCLVNLVCERHLSLSSD